MRIVICGGGIAGLTLAWWLTRSRHEVIVLERSSGLRSGGYMIDFFGAGWDVAERMGLLGKLEEIHYAVDSLDLVAEDGRTRASLPYARLRERFFDGRHFNFMRGDLERVLFDALDGRVEVRFGTSVATIIENGRRVRFITTNGGELECDLLVGADGVHSRVRELALPGWAGAVRSLGYFAAAYVVDARSFPLSASSAFQTMTVPGRQVAVYPVRDGKIATFFAHTAARQPKGAAGPGETLRNVYGDLGWVVPELLARVPRDEDVYFDEVSQVILQRWSAGRVALVGDACQAVSLLAGQGAAMAMGGAWALGQELADAETVEEALGRYQARVKPAIERKQRAGRRLADWFVPESRIEIALRDFFFALSARAGFSWIFRSFISGESIVA